MGAYHEKIQSTEIPDTPRKSLPQILKGCRTRRPGISTSRDRLTEELNDSSVLFIVCYEGFGFDYGGFDHDHCVVLYRVFVRHA